MCISPPRLSLAALFLSGCVTSTEPATREDLSAEVVPYEEQDDATREANARLKGYFPNHELITQDGEAVRFYDDLVRDRKVLINFMYVECDGL